MSEDLRAQIKKAHDEFMANVIDIVTQATGIGVGSVLVDETEDLKFIVDEIRKSEIAPFWGRMISSNKQRLSVDELAIYGGNFKLEGVTDEA